MCVLGYVDVHPVYGQAGVVGRRAAELRRGTLVQLRNQAYLSERIFVAERHERDRAASVLLKDGEAQRSLLEVLTKARAEAKARKTRNEALLAAISGEGNLFSRAMQCAATAPTMPQNVGIDAYAGLAGAGMPRVWGLVKDKFPAFAGLQDPGALSGYVVAVGQLFVRMPAVAVWLDSHKSPCGLVGCAVCVFRDVWSALGRPVVSRLVSAARSWESEVGWSVDVVCHAGRILDKWRSLELSAGRFGCDGDVRVTHVDRVFHLCSRRGRVVQDVVCHNAFRWSRCSSCPLLVYVRVSQRCVWRR